MKEFICCSGMMVNSVLKTKMLLLLLSVCSIALFWIILHICIKIGRHLLQKVNESKKYINELIIVFDVLQGFVADSMLGGFNLNQQADAKEYDAPMQQDNVAYGDRKSVV